MRHWESPFLTNVFGLWMKTTSQTDFEDCGVRVSGGTIRVGRRVMKRREESSFLIAIAPCCFALTALTKHCTTGEISSDSSHALSERLLAENLPMPCAAHESGYHFFLR